VGGGGRGGVNERKMIEKLHYQEYGLLLPNVRKISTPCRTPPAEQPGHFVILKSALSSRYR
jgi:hypothetical protein